MNPVHDATCSVAACAEILGAKWTAVLVHDLSEGPRRFTQLEHSCKGISPRTLSERLRALEQEEILVRRSYAESPPRVEYELTEKGEALLPIIDEMRRFGHEWLVATAASALAPRAAGRAPSPSRSRAACTRRAAARSASGCCSRAWRSR